MEAAFAWIGKIMDWFGQFFPRWVIVKPTEGYVKFVRGAKVVALTPGVHFWWPVTTELESHPTVRQTVDLRAQTFVTADGKTVVAGGLVVYEVHDIKQVCTTMHMPDEAVRDITLSAIHDVCCDKTWEQLQRGGRSLDTEMKNKAKNALYEYGITVVKVALTDLAPCRVLKLMHDSAPFHPGV